VADPEQATAVAEHPGAAAQEPPVLAGVEFAAALNVEQDPDEAVPSAGQSAVRQAEVAVQAAAARSALPASKSGGEASVAKESANPEQNRLAYSYQEQRGELAPAAAVAGSPAGVLQGLRQPFEVAQQPEVLPASGLPA
jgi:hypothetical protein